MSLWCSFDNAWHISLPTCQWAKRFVAWGAHQSSDALYVLISPCNGFVFNDGLVPDYTTQGPKASHRKIQLIPFARLDWLDGTCMNIHIIHHCTGHTAIPNHMKIVWGRQEVRTWKHDGPWNILFSHFFNRLTVRSQYTTTYSSGTVYVLFKEFSVGSWLDAFCLDDLDLNM